MTRPKVSLNVAAHIILLSVHARENDPRQLTVLQIAAIAMLLIGAACYRRHARIDDLHMDDTCRMAHRLSCVDRHSRHVSSLDVGTGTHLGDTHAAIIFSLEPVFATPFAVAVRGPGEWLNAA